MESGTDRFFRLAVILGFVWDRVIQHPLIQIDPPAFHPDERCSSMTPCNSDVNQPSPPGSQAACYSSTFSRIAMSLSLNVVRSVV
ncbi:MAG: hypothetical protein ABIG68_05525, partial [Acidobacteriota bacterium]